MQRPQLFAEYKIISYDVMSQDLRIHHSCLISHCHILIASKLVTWHVELTYRIIDSVE